MEISFMKNTFSTSVRQPHMRKRGFTLVEILVVVTIIGILLGLVFASFNIIASSTKKQRASVEVAMLGSALQRFKDENSFYPEASFITTNSSGYAIDAGIDGESGSDTDSYRSASSVLFVALMGRQVYTNSETFGPVYLQDIAEAQVFDDDSPSSELASGDSTVDPDLYISATNAFGTEQGAFRDPWNNPYGYYHIIDDGSSNDPEAFYNETSFDLWTTGNSTDSTNDWISNWNQ